MSAAGGVSPDLNAAETATEVLERAFGDSPGVNHKRSLAELAVEALAAAGFAVVQLPKPTSTRYEGEEHEPVDRLSWMGDFGHFDEVSVWDEGEVQLGYDGINSEPITTAKAISCAAALIAASAAAVGSLPKARNANVDRLAEKFKAFASEERRGGLPVGEEAAKKPWPGHCQNCHTQPPPDAVTAGRMTLMTSQKLRITAVLTLDATLYPPDDEDSQDWLLNDILLGDSLGRLILHSNEIGDELGTLHVETATPVGEEDEPKNLSGEENRQP